MGSGLGWRIGGVIGTLLVALFFMVPNLVQPLPSWWTAPLPTEGIHLGLDLQGGIHLVLEVDALRQHRLAASQQRPHTVTLHALDVHRTVPAAA